MDPNGDNTKNLQVSTLAEPNRGCDAIGCHQRDPGRPALDQAHDQLHFMKATTHRPEPGSMARGSDRSGPRCSRWQDWGTCHGSHSVMGLGLAVAYVLRQDKNQIQTLIETLTGPTERFLAALARWQCKVRDREERQRPLVFYSSGSYGVKSR